MASPSDRSSSRPTGLALRGLLLIAALACFAGGVVVAATLHGDTAFGFAVALWAVALMLGTVVLALNFDGGDREPAPPVEQT
jgi:hypothetical protein